MKRWISFICCIAILASATLSFAACNKKIVKNLDAMSGENAASAGQAGETLPPELQTNEDGERLAPPALPNINGSGAEVTGAAVTDASGVTVTDAVGNTVTEAVPATAANPAGSAAQQGTEQNSTDPGIRIACDRKKGLKVGDTVNVTVGIRNAKWLADVTINLYYDKNYLGIQKVKNHNVTDLMAENKDQGDYLMYAGYTMRTVDIADSDLFTVTFVVKKQPSGESKITYATANVFQWDVGSDAEGNNTASIAGTVPPVEVALHIDG